MKITVLKLKTSFLMLLFQTLMLELRLMTSVLNTSQKETWLK